MTAAAEFSSDNASSSAANNAEEEEGETIKRCDMLSPNTLDGPDSLIPKHQKNSSSSSPRQSCTRSAENSSLDTTVPAISMSSSEKLLFTDEVELTPPHLLQAKLSLQAAASTAGVSPWQTFAALNGQREAPGLASAWTSPFASSLGGAAVSTHCTRRTTTDSIPYSQRASSNISDNPAAAGVLRRRRTAADYVNNTSNCCSRQSVEQLLGCKCRVYTDPICPLEQPAGDGLKAAHTLKRRVSSKSAGVQFVLSDGCHADDSLQPKLRQGTPYPQNHSSAGQEQQQMAASDCSSDAAEAPTQHSQQSDISCPTPAAGQAAQEHQNMLCFGSKKASVCNNTSTSLDDSILPTGDSQTSISLNTPTESANNRPLTNVADDQSEPSVRFQVAANQGAGEMLRQPSFVRQGTPITQRPESNTQEQALLTARSSVQFILPDCPQGQPHDTTCREQLLARDPTPFRSHSVEQPICVRFTVAAGNGAGDGDHTDWQRYPRQPTPFAGRASSDSESLPVCDDPSPDTVHVRFLVSGRGAGEGDTVDHRPFVRTPTPFIGRAEGAGRVLHLVHQEPAADDPGDVVMAPASPPGSPPERTNSSEISLTGGSNVVSNQFADSVKPLQSLNPAGSNTLQCACTLTSFPSMKTASSLSAAAAAAAAASGDIFCSSTCTTANLQSWNPFSPTQCALRVSNLQSLQQSAAKLSVTASVAEVHIAAASVSTTQ